MSNPLNSLIAELRATIAAKVDPDLGPPSKPTTVLAQEMLLAHRIGNPIGFLQHISQHGQFPALEATSGDQVRAQLGTDGHVFLWVGCSAYDNPPMVVFLDPVLEEDHEVTACPWDTKGLMNHGVLGRRLTVSDAASLVGKYSLPAPDYRAFLAEVLHGCFQSPADYVRGRPPNNWYPGREGRPVKSVSGIEVDPAPQTFEARLHGDLPLPGRVLSVVFDSSWFANRFAPQLWRSTINGLKSSCARQQVRLRDLPKDPKMSRLSELLVDETEHLLRERGAL